MTENKSENKNKNNIKAMQNDSRGLSIANIPTGLSAALASDVRAMQVFSEMPDVTRKSFIDGARRITDRAEMRRYVEGIRNK